MRVSNAAALSRYSFHNGSSFSTLPFKILFNISDGVVDIGKGAEIMNVTGGVQPISLSLIAACELIDETLNLKHSKKT